MPHKINPIDFENSEGNLGVHCRHTLYFSVCPFASEQYCGVRPPPSDSARAPLPFRRPRQVHLADTTRSARATLNLTRSHPALRPWRDGCRSCIATYIGLRAMSRD
jgi:hypothetical protein